MKNATVLGNIFNIGFEEHKMTDRKIMVLNSLRYEQRYGYDIVKNIRNVYGKDLMIGVVYSILFALLKKGYVKASYKEEDREGNRGGYKKQYWKITKKGTEYLSQEKHKHGIVSKTDQRDVR